MTDGHGQEASNREANDAAASHAPVAHEPARTHEATAGAHEPELGPIDWPAWAAGALGVVLGAVVLVSMYASMHLAR